MFEVFDFLAAQWLLLPKLIGLNNIISGLKRFKRCKLKSVLIQISFWWMPLTFC